MTPESSDQVIQHAREVRRKQIEMCSKRAVQKIVAKFKTGKPSTEAVAKLIADQSWRTPHPLRRIAPFKRAHCLLFGGRLGFGIDGQEICSRLVGRAAEPNYKPQA